MEEISIDDTFSGNAIFVHKSVFTKRQIAENFDLRQEKKRLEHIIGGDDIEVVCILSGGVEKKSGNNAVATFSPASFSTADGKFQDTIPRMGTGGKLRAMAGVYISRLFPEILYVSPAVYCTEEEKEQGISHQATHHQYLIDRGVARKKIIDFPNDYVVNTLTEMIGILELAYNKGYTRFGITTNKYHLTRVQQMWDIMYQYFDHPASQQILDNYSSKNIDVTLNADLRTITNPPLSDIISTLKERGFSVTFFDAETILEKTGFQKQIIEKVYGISGTQGASENIYEKQWIESVKQRMHGEERGRWMLEQGLYYSTFETLYDDVMMEKILSEIPLEEISAQHKRLFINGYILGKKVFDEEVDTVNIEVYGDILEKYRLFYLQVKDKIDEDTFDELYTRYTRLENDKENITYFKGL